MKCLPCFLLIFCLVSCVSRVPIVYSTPDAADAALEKADYNLSLDLYRKFQKNNASSKFLMSARLGEARSLEGLEDWAGALAIYRSIYESTVQLQPKIATEALYRTSYCYEALGDDVKAAASLKDSLNRRQYLPDEVAFAEIPARLAMLYSKFDNTTEASQYLELAQKGFSALQGRRDIPKPVLAKACYQMGSVSLNQVSAAGFSQAVAGQKAVQRYLLVAMGMDIKPWSAESEEKLKKNLRDLWNTLVELPGLEEVDSEALSRRRLELQTAFSGEYIDLIENAELYLPLEAAKMNKFEKDLSSYLAEMKKRAQDLQYQQQSRMGLTLESEKLNGFKRPGQIKAKPPVAPKNKTAEDPNL